MTQQRTGSTMAQALAAWSERGKKFRAPATPDAGSEVTARVATALAPQQPKAKTEKPR